MPKRAATPTKSSTKKVAADETSVDEWSRVRAWLDSIGYAYRAEIDRDVTGAWVFDDQLRCAQRLVQVLDHQLPAGVPVLTLCTALSLYLTRQYHRDDRTLLFRTFSGYQDCTVGAAGSVTATSNHLFVDVRLIREESTDYNKI